MGVWVTHQYLDLSRDILSNPRSSYKPNRTGVDTVSLHGPQMEFDLEEGFPLLTTKYVHHPLIFSELCWFFHGDTNIKYLVDHDNHIWDDNAFQRYLKERNVADVIPKYSDKWHEMKEEYVERIAEDEEFAEEHGDLGPVYGKQWRAWPTSEGKEIDQLEKAVDRLRNSPQSRRTIVSAWNPAHVDDMELPPCHTMFHFLVREDEGEQKLDLKLYQRSADNFLGVPFNIASYAAVNQTVANKVDMEPGTFIHTFGDAHFYCGDGERGEFYRHNLDELKERVRKVDDREDYMEVKKWLLEEAPPERDGDGRVIESPENRKDHVPAILEQMSREPKELPELEIEDRPFEEFEPDHFTVRDYDPHPPIRGRMAV